MGFEDGLELSRRVDGAAKDESGVDSEIGVERVDARKAREICRIFGGVVAEVADADIGDFLIESSEGVSVLAGEGGVDVVGVEAPGIDERVGGFGGFDDGQCRRLPFSRADYKQRHDVERSGWHRRRPVPSD